MRIGDGFGPGPGSGSGSARYQSDNHVRQNWKPQGSNPRPQRFLSLMENRSRCDRGLTTNSRMQQRSPQRPSFPLTAPRTANALRPAQVKSPVHAQLLGGCCRTPATSQPLADGLDTAYWRERYAVGSLSVGHRSLAIAAVRSFLERQPGFGQG